MIQRWDGRHEDREISVLAIYFRKGLIFWKDLLLRILPKEHYAYSMSDHRVVGSESSGVFITRSSLRRRLRKQKQQLES